MTAFPLPPEELPLEVEVKEPSVLPHLLALLSDGRRGALVRYRSYNVTGPVTVKFAGVVIKEALEQGKLIDRTNGEGPMEEWDGWLIIYSDEPQYLQTLWSKTPDPNVLRPTVPIPPPGP